MPRFVLNREKQSDGVYEVHNVTTPCLFVPETSNQIDLGYHINCGEAITIARYKYPGYKINGCYYCCYDWHSDLRIFIS